ncbi:MAG: NAD(+)/NADH kinase [Candidatus Schekmanbacteria bacterium]|nr:NAD(+)/NADH kinase [Candidatus Schekmanbacteria bacterium]
MVPRVVTIFRPTEHDALLVAHGSRGNAAFFLAQRGRSLEEVRARHAAQQEALARVSRAVPAKWRRVLIARQDVDRFLFEPDDIVVAVGQDGLAANTAKYLSGQPVIGINPDPASYEGVLVPHAPAALAGLLRSVAEGRAHTEARTMVMAQADDGQTLLALNEVYVGHRSHQSARYVLQWQDATERQSSSGLIVASGTGATGWARSLHRATQCPLAMPAPTAAALAFFVREAWPSVRTGASVTMGIITTGDVLVLLCEMETDGVVFGDGLESDRLELRWGQRLFVGVAPTTLNLVV